MDDAEEVRAVTLDAPLGRPPAPVLLVPADGGRRGEAATPAGRLRLVEAVVDGARELRAHVDGVVVARLACAVDAGTGRLLLEEEPAQLERDAARPGAWARPPRTTVRWQRRSWVLLAAGPQRELHRPGRAEGRPLVRLSEDGAGHRLEWSDGACLREVVVASLLVVGSGPEAFRPR